MMRHARRSGGAARLSAACLATLLALSACGAGESAPKFLAADVSGVEWGKDFHLFDAAGAPRSIADYRGKVVMLYFGYTSCPDACPATLAKMAKAVDRLGTDGRRVQGLFVTLDPARDTRPLLRQYVRAFHPAFVDLSADVSTTASTAKEFKVFFEVQKPDSRGFYTVDHSSGIFVFDARGRLRVFMGPNIWIDAMVHDLTLLLQDSQGSDRT